MSTYNAKNYTEQGGDRLVIGGELEIKEGATVKGLETGGGEIPLATKDTLGGVRADQKPGSNYDWPIYIDPKTGFLYSRSLYSPTNLSFGLVKAPQKSRGDEYTVHRYYFFLISRIIHRDTPMLACCRAMYKISIP